MYLSRIWLPQGPDASALEDCVSSWDLLTFKSLLFTFFNYLLIFSMRIKLFVFIVCFASSCELFEKATSFHALYKFSSAEDPKVHYQIIMDLRLFLLSCSVWIVCSSGWDISLLGWRRSQALFKWKLTVVKSALCQALSQSFWYLISNLAFSYW